MVRRISQKEVVGVSGLGISEYLLGDCTSGALVDTSAALDTLSCIDDCDIVNGDCALGACVCACSACDTLVCVYCRHFETSAN